MLIPIGTEFRTRRSPTANYVLIAVNVLVFMFTDFAGGAVGAHLKTLYCLDAARPSLHQYVTYQFLHGGLMHLVGNMMFLWIFGNAVCDRMGPLGYILFYLAGGVFAGFAFTMVADNPILGASGAIAAVTTAFLVLFPRLHVTMLVWMLFIFTFRVPAMIVIVFKIILWDNILAPGMDQGAASNVAYSAHLGGYAFGFVVSVVLLAVRALPRNQFDMVALWDRWRRRSGLVGAPTTRGRGFTPRPITVEEIDSRPLAAVPLTPVERLREGIGSWLADGDLAAAAADYRRLLELDENQILARPQQLEIANYLAQQRRYREAAQAYQAFLTAYPSAADAGQVLLFIGLIYGRYLGEHELAAEHLRRALQSLGVAAQREMAEQELKRVEAHLSGRDSE